MRAILTLLATLGLVPGPSLPAVGAKVGADLLVYRVEETGLEPYFSRILVTADHLRLDEGDDNGGYTLYERSTGVIYNVDPEERSVLVIDPPRARPRSPVALELGNDVLPAQDLAPVDGIAPRRHRLLANGQVCEELTAVPGLMEEAMDAVADFYDRLADQHGTVVTGMPDELIDPCDLAQHVYAPRRSYGFGLPVDQRAPRVHRALVDHAKGVPSDTALFQVPHDFRRLAMPASASPSPE